MLLTFYTMCMYFKTYQVLFKLNMFQKCLCSTKLTSLTTKAFSITAVKPLSWRDERRDGSWNTYTVTTSIAVGERNQDLLKIILLILFLLLIIHNAVILPLRDQLLFLTKNNIFCITVFFMPYNNKSFVDKVYKNELGKYPAILSSCLVNNPHNCFFF